MPRLLAFALALLLATPDAAHPLPTANPQIDYAPCLRRALPPPPVP